MQEKVFIKNKKDLKLAAIIEKPNINEKFPFVILLHGFKGYKEEKTYSDLAKDLLKKSIASVRFNASGFGESEGNIEEDYRFSNYIEDVESIYEKVCSQKYVDKNRIAVFGASMGGMQAIIFAANHPEIKAVVSVSAPEKMGTLDTYGPLLSKWRKDGYLDIETSRTKTGLVRIPYEFIVDARKYDTRKWVKKVKVPIFVILGLADKNVAPQQTRDIFTEANEPKSLWEVPEMDHFYKNNPKILNMVNKKVVKFFRENL